MKNGTLVVLTWPPQNTTWYPREKPCAVSRRKGWMVKKRRQI
jgi:hypothetical protein